MAEPAWMMDTNTLSDLMRNPPRHACSTPEQHRTRRNLYQHGGGLRDAFWRHAQGLGRTDKSG